MKVDLGGNRLGSGNKMKLDLHNYERSNHDLGYIWRSTMAPGTLVPYLCEVALPGDSFDIKLDTDVKTYPTVGPLFGSFKLQLDVFSCPIRLYQGLLHNNPLGVGMKMADVKLPQMLLQTLQQPLDEEDFKDIDNKQINPSSILAYLGHRGIGIVPDAKEETEIYKHRNAVSWLAYWDIYKNYYANKQEEIGAMISDDAADAQVTGILYKQSDKKEHDLPAGYKAGDVLKIMSLRAKKEDIAVVIEALGLDETKMNLTTLCDDITEKSVGGEGWLIEGKISDRFSDRTRQTVVRVELRTDSELNKPQVLTFPLENIDEMRNDILKETDGNPFIITQEHKAPYGNTIRQDTDGQNVLRKSQHGLALKTYQSDIFNNWITTEWIDGAGGISEVTAIDVSDGKLKIDALILAKKVHNMLNRVAVSGGSYYDWIQAVYSENTTGMSETPMYMGGLSKEIVFQEVISNAETNVNGTNPLGTLAGKGGLSSKHKGGKVYIKVTEPSYIIGIVSITPRVDYSQGNRWDTRLQTMDDLHKPSLDGIGFQDLITDKMAWWDTHGRDNTTEMLMSAGKQPAWIDYQTNFNRTYGHFANQTSEMYMTLNRRYEADENGNIKDLTTYIDPSKFNYAFAMTDITSQNFWVQIGCDIFARRKVSAKQIPNL